MDFLKPADINAGVEEFRATPGARLVDVRTPGEYAGGHIAAWRGSRAGPQQRSAIASEVPDKSTLFALHERGAQPAGRSAPSSRWATPTRATSAASAAGAGMPSARGRRSSTAPQEMHCDGYSEARSWPQLLARRVRLSRKDRRGRPRRALTKNLSSIFRTIRSPGSCSKTSRRPSPTPTPSPPW